MILAVGPSAAKQLLGADVRLKEQHGQCVERPDGRLATATVQPAYVMRLQSVEPDAHAVARTMLVADLTAAAAAAGLIELPIVP